MLVHEEIPKLHSEPETVHPDMGLTEHPEVMETAAEGQFLLGEDIRTALQVVLQCLPLTEQEARSAAPLFDAWQEETAYGKGQLVAYTKDNADRVSLYRVTAAHTSRQSLPPDKAEELYSPVAETSTSILKEEI